MWYFAGVTIAFTVGVTFGAEFNVLEMTGAVTVTPSAGLTATAEVGIGIPPFYAKLVLEGTILEVKYPTKAEMAFTMFPLDIG